MLSLLSPFSYDSVRKPAFYDVLQVASPWLEVDRDDISANKIVH